ncbi:hypothetical protein F4824DRAFT_503918 [Ustulina deusta]|nr:hypothetical protein F4824DRAFT_503918 [Ustulina deusta]
MDEVWWYLTHVLAITTHLALLLAGIVAFPVVSAVSMPSFEKSEFESTTIRVSLAWGCGLAGMLGLIISSVIFSALQKAHKAVGHSAYFQRQVTTIIGACVAMTLVVGDIVMATALGRQGSVLFGGLCAITAFAAIFTAISVIADIVKLYTFDREDAEEDRLMWESQRIAL